ncbi:hypothetical protein [Pseudomonas putida]
MSGVVCFLLFLVPGASNLMVFLLCRHSKAGRMLAGALAVLAGGGLSLTMWSALASFEWCGAAVVALMFKLIAAGVIAGMAGKWWVKSRSAEEWSKVSEPGLVPLFTVSLLNPKIMIAALYFLSPMPGGGGAGTVLGIIAFTGSMMVWGIVGRLSTRCGLAGLKPKWGARLLSSCMACFSLFIVWEALS